MSESRLFFVIVNCPGEDVALQIGRAAIECGLAKAFNISAPMKTGYLWQGQYTENVEYQLLFKIEEASKAPLFELAKKMHPFEVAAIKALPITDTDPDYLAFVLDRNAR